MYKSPKSLVDCSLRSLTAMCLSAVHKTSAQTGSDCRNKNVSELSFHGKRKLELDEEYPSSSVNARPKKRMRRKSLESSTNTASVPVPVSPQDSSSKDDCCVSHCASFDVVIVLRNYIKCIPIPLWNKIFIWGIKCINNMFNKSESWTVIVKSFEFLFSKYIFEFSSRLLCRDIYIQQESFVFERFRLCKNMRRLSIYSDINPKNYDLFLDSIKKLRNLVSVVLIPDTRKSMHFAVPVIAEHCKLVEELRIVYDSEVFCKNGYNVSLLRTCSKLTKLMLFSFGKGCETDFIESLLHNLINLKYLSHREISHVITNIYLKTRTINIPVFNLKTLSLVMYCQSIGSQLSYLPDDSFEHIFAVCPNVQNLKIVRPSNLATVCSSVPSLYTLEVHDFDAKESFRMCASSKALNNLTVLILKNIDYLDFGCFPLMFSSCPELRELEILQSNIFCSNELRITCNFQYPKLKKLKILKFYLSEQTDPRFVFPHTLNLDKNFIKYILKDRTLLQELFLEFDPDEGSISRERDELSSFTEEEFTDIISGCKELTDLMLISCPNVTFGMIDTIVKRCVKFQHLWNVDFWNIPRMSLNKIIEKYSFLFAHS